MKLSALQLLILAIFAISAIHADHFINLIDPARSQSPRTWKCVSRIMGGVQIPVYYINRTDPGLAKNIQGILQNNFTTIQGSLILAPAYKYSASIDEMLKTITEDSRKYGYNMSSLVLVPLYNGQWYSNPAKNMQYLVQLTLAAQVAGYKVEIYSRQNDWKLMFADEWDSQLNAIPVWYLGGTRERTLSDWKENGFGQFTNVKGKFLTTLTGTCGENFIMQMWRP